MVDEKATFDVWRLGQLSIAPRDYFEGIFRGNEELK